jgi:xylulokinase
MDAWAGLFGTGTIVDDSGMYLSGTSEILGILSPSLTPTPGVLVMPRIHDMTLHVGPTQSGGASQSWFCQLMHITPEDMAALAATHGRDRTYPLFLPHLQGERAPLWDAGTRGVFLGLDASTDRAAMALAVYDGVACSARWLLESLQRSAGTSLTRLNGGGGGFRSDVWNQLRSDVLGVQLCRVAATDPGTLGAAGLGAVAAGLYSSPQAAFRDLVTIDTHYEPDLTRRNLHDERMALYRQAYENTRTLSPYWA